MDVSIIITTFNRCELLKRNLQLLKEQTFDRNKFEVLVCDDNSFDGTKKMVEEIKVNVNYSLRYFNTENSPEVFGACKARNIGLWRAKNEIVLFIDDDILLHKQAIERHVKFFEGNSKKHKHINSVGYVSGNEEELNATDLNFPPTNPKWKSREKRFPEWQRGSCVNTAYLRKDLIAVGGWDGSFTKYGYEEKDLNYRLFKEKKMKFLLNLQAIGVHIPTKHSLSKKEKREGAKEMIKYLYGKHPIMRRTRHGKKKK